MRRKVARRFAAILAPGLFFLFLFLLYAQESHVGKEARTESEYVGPQACVDCHEKRVNQVLASNHANSWRPASALEQRDAGPQKTTVDGITYEVVKEDGNWVYQLQLPGRPVQKFPIHSLMGGKRLGLAMILEVRELEGRQLPRPALVEARYMLSPKDPVFRLAPGFPGEKPSNYSNAIGHVLSPTAAEKCFSCHGGILDAGLAQKGDRHPELVVPGVTCESCHGPASAHVEAARAKEADLKIVHPGKLPNREIHKLCAPCHTGFFPREQPRPADLEVANQLTALIHSECYVKSGEGLSCLTCHNPHIDARRRGWGYDAICLDCHSSQQQVHCPVSPKKECINCHMPEIVLPEDFHVTDHWIRVVDGSDPKTRAYKLENQAVDLLEAGKAEEAIKLLRQSIDLYPEFIHGWVTLGNAYNRIGEFEKEENCYREAIRIAPNFHQAHHDLGALLFSNGDAEGALRSFQRAVQIRPDLVRTYVNLSTVLRALGQVDEAISAAERAVVADPLLPAAHYVLGAAHSSRDRNKALASFEMAAFLEPANPGFQLTFAATLAEIGRTDEAKRLLREITETFPDFPPADAALKELERREKPQ